MFQVHVSAEAESNARQIHSWLSNRSPQGAQKWLDSLERVIHEISEHADRFALAPENYAFSEPLRQALFRTPAGRKYRVLYVVRESTAMLLAIRAPGQDLLSDQNAPLPDS